MPVLARGWCTSGPRAAISQVAAPAPSAPGSAPLSARRLRRSGPSQRAPDDLRSPELAMRAKRSSDRSHAIGFPTPGSENLDDDVWIVEQAEAGRILLTRDRLRLGPPPERPFSDPGPGSSASPVAPGTSSCGSPG